MRNFLVRHFSFIVKTMKPNVLLTIHISLIAVILRITDAARILAIFPIPSYSYLAYNQAIMKSIIDAGHEVTIITPYAEQVKKQAYRNIISIPDDGFNYPNQYNYTNYADMDFWQMLITTAEWEKPYCQKVYDLSEIQYIFTRDYKDYDLIFVGVSFLYKCFLPIAAKLEVPMIGTVMESVLNRDTQLDILEQSFDDYLSTIVSTAIFYWYNRQVLNPILDEFYKNNKNELGLSSNYKNLELDLVFHNTHVSLNPTLMKPNIIEIGGISAGAAEPLPEDIRYFIRFAEHGIIVMSFGSVTKAEAMPKHVITAFRDAFAEIPQKVIWKFEEEIEDLPYNVLIQKWIPQRALLDNENVKVFINHCGQGSTYEAIYSGTPVVTCPLFGDQFANAALLERLEIAVRLDFNEISKETILAAINEVIHNNRYQENAKKRSKMFLDRPMTPQQSVAYWTDYMLRQNGAPHLKLPQNKYTPFQHLLLHILCVVSVIYTVIMFICKLFRLIGSCCGLCVRKCCTEEEGEFESME